MGKVHKWGAVVLLSSVLLALAAMPFSWAGAQESSAKQRVLNRLDQIIAEHEAHLKPADKDKGAAQHPHFEIPAQAIVEIAEAFKATLIVLRKEVKKMPADQFAENLIRHLLKKQAQGSLDSSTTRDLVREVGEEVLVFFPELLKGSQSFQRAELLFMVGDIASPKGLPLAREYVHHQDGRTAQAAMYALIRCAEPNVKQELQEYFKKATDPDRLMEALRRIKTSEPEFYQKSLIQFVVTKRVPIQAAALCGQKFEEAYLQDFLSQYLDLYRDLPTEHRYCYLDVLLNLQQRQSLNQLAGFFPQILADAYQYHRPLGMYGRPLEGHQDSPVISVHGAKGFLSKLKAKLEVEDWQNWLSAYQPQSPEAIYIQDILVERGLQAHNGLESFTLQIDLYDRDRKLLDQGSVVVDLNNKFSLQLHSPQGLSYDVSGKLIWLLEEFQYQIKMLMFVPSLGEGSSPQDPNTPDSQRPSSGRVPRLSGAGLNLKLPLKSYSEVKLVNQVVLGEVYFQVRATPRGTQAL